MAEIWGSLVKLRKELIGCDHFSKGIYGRNYQRVLFGSKYHETVNRFIVKAMISKILFDNNVSFVTEWKYHRDRKVLDVMPIIDVEQNIIYRFNEKKKITIKHKNFNERLIKLQRLRTDLSVINDLEIELREWLGLERKVPK